MYIDKLICKNCKHENVCKWIITMDTAQMEVGCIQKLDNTPIKINIKCDEFNIKTQKQEGFTNQR